MAGDRGWRRGPRRGAGQGRRDGRRAAAAGMGGEHRLNVLPGPPTGGQCPPPRDFPQGGGSRVEADGREALGRSRGGLTSRIHLLAGDWARPPAWQTSPGQAGATVPCSSPCWMACGSDGRGPRRPRSRPDRVRGDKAYSSYDNRAYLRRRGIKATIAQPYDQRAKRRRKGRAGTSPGLRQGPVPPPQRRRRAMRQQVEAVPRSGQQVRRTRLRFQRHPWLLQ